MLGVGRHLPWSVWTASFLVLSILNPDQKESKWAEPSGSTRSIQCSRRHVPTSRDVPLKVRIISGWLYS